MAWPAACACADERKQQKATERDADQGHDLLAFSGSFVKSVRTSPATARLGGVAHTPPPWPPRSTVCPAMSLRLWHRLGHRPWDVSACRKRRVKSRLRRMADRNGLRLVKSRSRDPRAVDYGLYALIDVRPRRRPVTDRRGAGEGTTAGRGRAGRGYSLSNGQDWAWATPTRSLGAIAAAMLIPTNRAKLPNRTSSIEDPRAH
jgi:hypothetical protein